MLHLVRVLLTAACFLGTAKAFAEQPAAQRAAPTPTTIEKIPADWVKRLASVPRDPASMVNSTHYITSNENRHEKFRETLRARPKGGIYVGIGADQNYLLIGWARPDLALLTDFDLYVVDVHHVHAAFFSAAQTPEAFIRLWTPKGNSRDARAALHAYAKDEAHRTRMWNMYRYAKKSVHERLTWLRRHLRKKRVPSVFTDDDDYSAVRSLVRAGRVIPLVADLTGSKAVSGIGRAARDLKLPVRTFFTSNAEHYFPYRKNFRDNLLSLPFDAHSLVLRTRSLGAGKYEYYTQSMDNMRAYMQSPHIKRVTDICARRTKTSTPLLFRIEQGPSAPEVPIPRRHYNRPVPKKDR